MNVAVKYSLGALAMVTVVSFGFTFRDIVLWKQEPSAKLSLD